MKTIKLTFITICFALSSYAQKQNQQVMLLGVYHFDNPGKDTHNMNIDDYFIEKRQQEIHEVVSKLADFKPTKILVEFLPEIQPKLDSLYKLYLNGKIGIKDIPGGRNEVYQLGFKLAKQLDLPTPKAIDYPGFWLGDYVDFIADTLRYHEYVTSGEKRATYIAERSKRFQKQTVMENLSNLNEWKEIMANHDYYNNVAIAVRDEEGIMLTYQEQETEIEGLPYYMRSFDFNNIGIEMIAEWYKRNLFIYRSILDNIDQNDRVLVIFGSGHIRYLHQLLSDNPTIELIDTNKYLKK